MILLTIILTAFAAFIALCFYLSYYATHINRNSFDEILRRQREQYDVSFYDEIEVTDYKVKSYDGYVIPVWFLKNPSKTDRFGRYVLITHGHTENHLAMLKYAKMYMEMGFDVILHDLRGHGENEKTFCTFGIREAKDLNVLIKDCRKRYPDAAVFGIHGESLGSATSVTALKDKPDIDFVVADCGFADIIDVMKGQLKNMHLPTWLVYPTSLCSRIVCGYSFIKMRPIDSLKDNKIPILFIHGASDTYIKPDHSERLKEANGGPAWIYTIPDAEHAESMLKDPAAYRSYVREFFRNINIPVE